MDKELILSIILLSSADLANLNDLRANGWTVGWMV